MILHSIASAWSPMEFVALAVTLWLQTTLLLALGLAGIGLLRRQRPSLRCLVARATLCGVSLCLMAAWLCTGHRPAVWNVSLAPSTALSPPNSQRADAK